MYEYPCCRPEPTCSRSQRRSTAARALAFMVALLFVLGAPLSAEAKKKKGEEGQDALLQHQEVEGQAGGAG